MQAGIMFSVKTFSNVNIKEEMRLMQILLTNIVSQMTGEILKNYELFDRYLATRQRKISISK